MSKPANLYIWCVFPYNCEKSIVFTLYANLSSSGRSQETIPTTVYCYIWFTLVFLNLKYAKHFKTIFTNISGYIFTPGNGVIPICFELEARIVTKSTLRIIRKLFLAKCEKLRLVHKVLAYEYHLESKSHSN